MMRTYVLLPLLLLAVLSAGAQRPCYAKLSPMLRRCAAGQQPSALQARTATRAGNGGLVCAFVRIASDADSILRANGCRHLAQYGDIHIAEIPLRHLGALTLDRRVLRVEAERGTRLQLDSMALMTHTLPVYAGTGLPQAYTGSGVVVGVQDVGFDLTHPTFLRADGTESRIRRFWDQLSTDTLGAGRRYVGAEYTTPEVIAGYARSRDGLLQYHGTHTAGIAAGAGRQDEYRGLAYGSDLCLVSNAVSGDESLIDSADIYKYTYATDALGFQYIFDYAAERGLPCVVSFSEGSPEDARGDDQLYYEVLRRMTGPGRILVASAGNLGHVKNYLHKARGRERAGSFYWVWGDALRFSLSSADDFTLRLVLYGTQPDTLAIDMRGVTALPDSTLTDTVTLCGRSHVVDIVAYRSCYDAETVYYDVTLSGQRNIGSTPRLSVELTGRDADVSLYRINGELITDAHNPALADGDASHSVYSPGSAPSVICTGATSYRASYRTDDGSTVANDWGTDDALAGYSSVGPTLDGRVKPDVVAPGSNIISAMSSYYMEAHPDGLSSLTGRFDAGGRTYGWCAETGTSMSTPAVAGIIALWLEACPTLSPEDVLGVLARTCRPVGGISQYPDTRCGYGRIDAYAGLLDVLGLTAIDGLSTAPPAALRLGLDRQRLILTLAGEARQALRVAVYSISGRRVATHTLAPGRSRYEVDLTGLPQGVYAVQVSGPSADETGSVLVRL